MFRRLGRSYGNATQTIANDLDRFKIYTIVPIVQIELNSIQAIKVVSVVWVVCDHVGSVSIWSSRSSEHFFELTGTIGTIIWKPGFSELCIFLFSLHVTFLTEVSSNRYILYVHNANKVKIFPDFDSLLLWIINIDILTIYLQCSSWFWYRGLQWQGAIKRLLCNLINYKAVRV